MTNGEHLVLRIGLPDGRRIVATASGDASWLTALGERVLISRSDFDTSGQTFSTVVTVDVEGHLVTLNLRSLADAERLRRGLAIAALTATIAVGGAMTPQRTTATTIASINPPQPTVTSISERAPHHRKGDSIVAPVVVTVAEASPTAVRRDARQGASRRVAESAQPGLKAEATHAPGSHSSGIRLARRSGISALPAPRYADVLTPRQEYGQWDSTLLDPTYMVAPGYRPPDLVSVARANIRGGDKVRAFVIDDLRALAAAARDAGCPVAVTSAFRSHEQQKHLFQGYVERHGVEQARRESARPGHSEHQLGTALDFKSEGGPDPWNVPDWAATEAGSWMELNAWRYGFVMSYPDGASDVTGYMYEPWHYRYVGRTAAAHIHRLRVTTREWLYSLGAAEPDA